MLRNFFIHLNYIALQEEVGGNSCLVYLVHTNHSTSQYECTINTKGRHDKIQRTLNHIVFKVLALF